MDRTKKLPIGIEDFEKLRTENFYYVDKTGMIKELLENWGEVNLFARPRNFIIMIKWPGGSGACLDKRLRAMTAFTLPY